MEIIQGSRPGHRPGPLQAKSGHHRLLLGSRRGPGRISCVLSFKKCPRVPGGSRQWLRRTPARQITGLNYGIFLTGARVTFNMFKLELKVTFGVPPGPVRDDQKWPKTARELPGKAPFVKCDRGITRELSCLSIIFNVYQSVYNPMIKLSKLENLYFNISSLILRWEPSGKFF